MAVTGLDLESRPFEADPRYEELFGTAHFALDPQHPRNAIITDLELAPRQPDGRVHFSADVSILRPADAAARSDVLLLDVVNRGFPVLQYMCPAPADRDWLYAQGQTIVRCGWQHDVSRQRIGMDIVEALTPQGERITGRVSRVFEPDAAATSFRLGDEAVTFTAADANEADAVLLDREYAFAPARTIPRDEWAFSADGTQVNYEHGFLAGRQYEVLFTAIGAPLTGIGLAAQRDIVSFLRFSADAANPCAGGIRWAIALGVSQSARTLRTLVYYGLCEDEDERLVLDGMLAHTGGGRLLEANYRFGQSSYNGWDSLAAVFPFCDEPQTDPATGEHDGLLLRAIERGRLPKIVYTNTSAEYWGGQIGGMAHVAADGCSDAAIPANVRTYALAGTQHAAGTLDDKAGIFANSPTPRSAYALNSIDYSPLARAALANTIAWVTAGIEPPPNAVGRIDDGTLVERESLREPLAILPGPGLPAHLANFHRLDFGADAKRLRRTQQLPPAVGELYRSWVSAVDADGNEVAGVRHPDVSVPLATYTGWTPRHPAIGGEDQNLRVAGATIVLPRTASADDLRPSIADRYESKDDFLRRVRAAADELVRQRHMLPYDVDAVVANSAARWDLYTT